MFLARGRSTFPALMTSIDARLSGALADRYRLERELGQGGMATVYLAEDLKHHRKVAIKVLHPELSAVLGSERFLKEIELTANLQHPHILPLFDSGAADGLLYYVMPYVEGESLRSRLTREKQLPIPDAVRIAGEAAGALDYAHRRNVVHRDIKPENILLHDGRALVADFGIALAVVQAGGSRMTQTGLSLGTPQYMSPEQAMGEREISPRSDLYALGCVTYEMLTGEPPFTGPTAQAIVARVMTEAPRPITSQRHTVPEHVEAAVLTALEKLPADRFASASEFAAALSGSAAVRQTGRLTGAPATAAPPHRRTVALTIVPWALSIGLAALAGWALLHRPALPRQAEIRVSLTPPGEIRILDIGGPPAVISPDGSTLVFVGRVMGRSLQLFRWALAGGLPIPLAGTENGQFPFFSPDGASVGFLANGQLRRVPLEGGSVLTIGNAPGSLVGSVRGITWTDRGEIVFATTTQLWRIPVDGSPARSLELDTGTSDTLGRLYAHFPDAMPGGGAILAGVMSAANAREPELALVSLADGKVTPLGQAGENPHYVQPGYVAFTNSRGSLLAVRFDRGARRVVGPPRTIAEGVMLGTGGYGKLSVSRAGTVVYFEGLIQEQRHLLRVDRQGKATPLEASPRNYNAPRISPDGRRIVVTVGPVPNPPMDLWVFDLKLGNLLRVTSDSTSTHAEWSADGERLIHRQAGVPYHVMATTPDGSQPPVALYETRADLWEVVPSRTGDTLITRELSTPENDRDLLLVPLKPRGPAVPFAAGPRIQAEPALSPDGKWLAYASEESGSFEVYVRAFPGPGPRYQASAGGGTAPRWNPRGGELFLLSRDSVVAVSVHASGAGLELGRGKGLFANQFAPLNYHAPYDVSPDGSWFVFVGGTGTSFSSSVRLVLNWFEQPDKQ